MTDDATYGRAFADVYDEWYESAEELAAMLEMLAAFGPRGVLELGVGTGRVAIPLAGSRAGGDGPTVVGVDESPEMLRRLREKDVSGRVHAVLGDMADESTLATAQDVLRGAVDGAAGPGATRFDLVVVSYNTLFNLTRPGAQARCIGGVARCLAPDGRLVVDACVIDEAAPAEGESVARRGCWTLRTSTRFDPGTGLIEGEIHSRHDDGRTVPRPFTIRYTAPGALDAMCAEAGLGLMERHESWTRDAFTGDSPRHVSVYRPVR